MSLHFNETGTFEILLALPSAADAIVREARAAREAMFTATRADNIRGDPGGRPGGYRVERRIALVPVIGSLVPRGPAAMARYGLTSYEGLRDELRRAGDDGGVDVVALMIDSPGGYVTGIDATSDAILAARTRKPVVAIVEGMCASAAYWIASQCDAIIAAPFAQLGSIGALIVHVDVSGALASAGLNVTVVRAGARKAETMPFEPLSDEAEAELQANVDRAREAFAKAVAAGRAQPGLDVSAVMATEARMFNVDAAVAMGLADRIGTLDGFVARMPMPAAIRRSVAPALALPRLETPETAPLAVEPAASAPMIEPVIGRPEARKTPTAQPTDAITAERARVAGIMSHAFASHKAGRIMATHLVEQGTGLAEAEALMDGFLERLDSTPAPMDLDQEMAADMQPIIGAYGGEPGAGQLTGEQKGAATAARLLGKDVAEAIAKAGKMGPSAIGGRER